MEKSKIDNQGSIIKVFICIALVIGFIGGFVIADDLKERFIRAVPSKSTNESSDILTAGIKNNRTYGFDERYIDTDTNLEYKIDFGTYAGSSDIYFTLGYGDVNSNLVVTKYSYDNENVQEHTLSFVSNVVDVFFGRFDDEPLNNTIFYLLENGDVCYSLIEDMIKLESYGTYNTITDVRNVVKFYSGESCNEETLSCKSTTLAQTKDGKIIDLSSYIVK